MVFLAAGFFMPVSAAAQPPGLGQQAKDEIVVETLLRLDGFSLDASPQAREAAVRWLRENVGGPRFFLLLRKYPLRELDAELLQLALARPTETVGVDAARMLVEHGQTDAFRAALDDPQDAVVQSAIAVLGLAAPEPSVPLLLPLVEDSRRSVAVRSAAVGALGRGPGGQQELWALVEAGRLGGDLEFAAANALHNAPDAAIRDGARKRLKLPEARDSQPLPPLAELVKLRGQAARGRAIFLDKGTCGKCHVIADQGKEVGPNLSEIGNKLSRDALFVSLLAPSAAISHSYETYVAQLDNGTVATGILTSQTDESVTLKTAEALEQTIPRDQIEELRRQDVSLMPADLQKLLTIEELVDVVEFLASCKGG